MARRTDILRQRVDLETREAESRLNRYTQKIEQSNQKMARSSRQAAKGFADVRVSMLAVGAAVAGVGLAVREIDRLAQKADKVSNLSTAFDTLTRRIDSTSSQALSGMRRATRGLVTDLDLMRLTNNAVILGVAKSEQEFARLTDGAVRLGRAVGLDATTAIESLVTGIGRQSRMMLDNLGIIVRAEDAYAQFAQSVGKSVSELTDAERKTAFATAAINGMEQALVGLNAETGRLSDKWNQAKTTIANRVNEILDELNKLPETVSIGLEFLRGGPSGREAGEERARRALDFSSDRAARAAVRAGERLPSHPIRDIAIDQQKEMARLQEITADWAEKELKFLRERNQAQAELLQMRIERLELPGKMPEAPLVPVETESIPDVLKLEQAEAKFDSFTSTVQHDIDAVLLAGFEQMAVQLADVFVGGEQSFNDFLKTFMKGITAAIAKMLILRSIAKAFGFGGGGVVGTSGHAASMSHGGIIGAQHGMLLSGGVDRRDSIPIVAQRREAVLPRFLTEFLLDAASASKRSAHLAQMQQPESGGRPGQTFRTENRNEFHFHGTVIDQASVRRFFEDHPEAFAAGQRNAVRRGVL